MLKGRRFTRKNAARTDDVDDGDDNTTTEGAHFWINKSGFPITSQVWERMFDYAAKINPEGRAAVDRVRRSTTLPSIPVPKPPLSVSPSLSPPERIALVQEYMCDLQYNHTGTQFFDIKKYRTLSRLNDTAKQMIRESLPIKCLEAVILGIYLTNGIPGIERIPMGFHTVFGSITHRHVILAIGWNGMYGAVGMSRRKDLMYKNIEFAGLADLAIDYIECYHQYWHKVTKLKIGYPVSHDQHSQETIQWKGLAANPSHMTKDELRASVDKHAKDIKAWLRQAPLGSNYIPKVPYNYGHSPSHNTLAKHLNIRSVSESTNSSLSTLPDKVAEGSPKKEFKDTKTFNPYEMRI